MPAIKCMTCKRYSIEKGCELDRSNRYFEFRACMLDEQDFYIPKNEKKEVKKSEIR